MAKETFNNIRLGVFVITGLILLVAGLYFIGNNKNLFGDRFELYATFDNVSGLQKGNNVRFSGIDVGTVDEITILNDTSLRVKMVINQDLLHHIRKNSYAAIGTDGLMGNKLININPGTPESPVVSEGDEIPVIPTVDTESMLRTLEGTNQNVLLISNSLRDIISNIQRSRGTLYTVLMDTSLATGLRRTLTNLEGMSDHLEGFSGDLGLLVDDVRSGEGVLSQLVTDSSAFQQQLSGTLTDIRTSGRNLSEATDRLNRILGEVEGGNGTIQTLLKDPATADHLRRSIANIDSSTASFNENMKALQQNFLFRKYFRKKASGN